MAIKLRGEKSNSFGQYYAFHFERLHFEITVWPSWLYSIPTHCAKLRLGELIAWCHVSAMNNSIHYCYWKHGTWPRWLWTSILHFTLKGFTSKSRCGHLDNSIPTHCAKLRLMDELIVWCYVQWMLAFITVVGNMEHDQDGDNGNGKRYINNCIPK